MQKIGIVMVLALALFSVPAFAQNTIAATGPVDILAQGIFESDGSAVQIPPGTNANIDGVIVGNDKALAFGSPWKLSDPIAQNDLEIKKNQQMGTSVVDIGTNPATLVTYPLINAEQIKVGDRQALAFGAATATNHVKIVTNQMGGDYATVESTP